LSAQVGHHDVSSEPHRYVPVTAISALAVLLNWLMRKHRTNLITNCLESTTAVRPTSNRLELCLLKVLLLMLIKHLLRPKRARLRWR
jgi:hypothetical protein